MNQRTRRIVAAANNAARPLAEQLERRTLFAAVSWTGAAGDGNLLTPGNWSTNALPSLDDDVTIDVPGKKHVGMSENYEPPFSHPSLSIRSLTTAEDIGLGGAGLGVTDGITLRDDATITVATSVGYFHTEHSSTLFVGGAITGQGKVYVSSGGYQPSSLSSSGPLTIGHGVTVGGSGGYISATIVNEGSFTGGTPDFYGNPRPLHLGGDFTNNGTVGASGDILLDATGFHPGTGQLIAQNRDATITLTGSFTQASLGNLVGSTDFPHFIVGLGGNLTGGLVLDATTGSWAFNGGTMRGGIYRATGGASLQLQSNSYFDGVSIASDVTVNPGKTLTVEHDLELLGNAKVHLSGGTLQFAGGGHQNLVGEGEVLFESGSNLTSVLSVLGNADVGPATLATESGVTIRTNGGDGVIGDDALPNPITSNGLILASSGTITLRGNFINQGTLQVDAGGTIDLHTHYSGSGQFKVTGGTLNLSGSFMQADVSKLVRTGGQVVVTGTITGGLVLNAATGSWDFNGGTLVGGTYTASDGAMLRSIAPSSVKLDGVTITADLLAESGAIFVAHTLTFANNARILLQNALNLGAGAALAGQGEVVLTGGLPRVAAAPGDPLTIPAGLTIRSQGGNATLGEANSPVINQGVIAVEAAGAALEVQGRLANGGTARVTAGALTIDALGVGEGVGLIDVQGGTLILAGTVAQAAFNSISHTGGDINLTGTITGGLALNAAIGSVNLAGGRFAGGTYTATGGARLRVTAESKFDGVTVASDLDVVSSVAAVSGGLTLANGAAVHLVSSTAAASLEFRDGSQTLGGAGEVRFEGALGGLVRAVRYADNTAAKLTIGPDVTIRDAGGVGAVGGGGRLTSVANNGVVSAEGTGRTITFKDTVDNNGSILSSDGASLAAAGSFNNFGALTLGPAAVFTVRADAAFNSTGGVTFQIGGSPQVGLFGRISSAVPLALKGVANVELVGGFQPAVNNAYTLVQATVLSGAFDVVNGLVVDGVTRFTQSLTSTAFTVTATGQVAPPLAHVTDVFVAGSSWSSMFLQALSSQGAGDPTFGHRLGAGDADLPWTNLDRVSVRFDRPVNVESADLAISGVRTASHSVSAFNYDATTNTATWTLVAPFAADATLLDLKSDASGVSAADGGRALDGDQLGQLPSGDGAAGGDFRLRLNVLPGDVNQSGGSINAADLVLTRNRVGHAAATPGSGAAAYTVFNDLNGDGIINASDVVLVRNRVGAALPVAPGFNYSTFSSTAGLDLFGDAAQTGDTLRLVPASEHHNGAVRRRGVQNSSQGFSTSFTFRYANVGGILDDSGNHGTDGIAFTIQPVGSGMPVLAGGGLSIWFDAYRDGSDVSSSRVGVYRDGALVKQFDAEALGIRYREGAAHTAQIDSSGSAIAIRLDGHLLGQIAANVGGSSLVGFAGFAGEAYADQELSNWSFRPTALEQPAVVFAKEMSRRAASPRAASLLE